MKSPVIFLIPALMLLSSSHQVFSQEIWGTTKYGGKYEKGVIFKMDENAHNQEMVFSFDVILSAEGRMSEYSEGIFYGMTYSGGQHNKGVIYRFESDDGAFTKILDFKGVENGSNGAGSLIKYNGKLYGMTTGGGIHDMGILFEYDPVDDLFIKLVDFNGEEKGSEPLGSLVISSEGPLYGMTSMGGIHDVGVLFSYHPGTGEFSKKVEFNGHDMGSNPMGSLLGTSDGMLYGMTRWGGENDHGIIFHFNSANEEYNVIFEFYGEETGRNPHGSLIEASNGKLYGLTPFGGSYNAGVLFEFIPESLQYNVKYEFTGGFNSGIWPYGDLVQAGNGKLYGVSYAEFFSDGILFEFDPETNTYERFWNDYYTFRVFSGHAKSLILAGDGKLYYFFTNENNVLKRELSLVAFDPDEKKYTRQYRFSAIETGGFPLGMLMQAADGMLYGTTTIGGIYNQGVVYRFNPFSYEYNKLFDFDGALGGSTPHNGLVQATNQKLYGLTREGGSFDKGVLYEIDPVTGDFSKKVDFDGTNGQYPDGYLVLAGNGRLYGTTPTGGVYDEGVFFEFNTETGQFTKLIDFQGEELGKNPYSNSLVAASNGLVYGTTQSGGLLSKGVLFEYNPVTNAYTKSIEFGVDEFDYRPADLIETNDNQLCGLAGELFQFDLSDYSVSRIPVADLYLSSSPLGKLLHAKSGKFYGMSPGYIWFRSTEFEGELFEIDLESQTGSVIVEFNGSNGSIPDNSSLIQIRNYSPPIARCKTTTIFLDENGQAILHPEDLDDGSSGSGMEITVSKSIFTCEDAGENHVILTVADEQGTTDTCETFVSVADTIPPVAICRDMEIYLDASGYAAISAKEIDDGSDDVCGIQSMTLDITTFSEEKLGENSVVLTVSDNNGNVSTCTAIVKVLNQAPSAAVCQDLDVYLDSNGMANIGASEIINGSYDADEIKSMTLDISSFTCEDVGENTVVLTVTDNNDNVSTCSTTVNVIDNLAPEALCRDIEIFLDASGYGAIDAEEIDNGSADICGIHSMTLDITTFSEENIGENTVVLTVTDNNGNVSTCTAIVKVLDQAPSAAVCQDLDVYLDSNGMANIDASEIINSSYDADEIKSITLDISSFTCADVGENTVVLTVTDNNDNVSTCVATVTVTDNLSPEIYCLANSSLIINPYEEFYLMEGDNLDAVVADNCGIESLIFTINGDEGTTGTSLSGVHLNAGIYELVWLATNIAGNQSICNSVIHIERRPTTLVFVSNEVHQNEGFVEVKVILMDVLLLGGIAEKSLVFAIDEFTEIVETDENGMAVLRFSPEEALSGNYSVTARFEEDATYTGSTLESEIVTGLAIPFTTHFNVYPNPFSERLQIEFISPESANARIDLYDSSGRLVKTIFNQPVEAGMFYKTEFSPNAEAGSSFIYQMNIGGTIHSGKVIYRH